MPINESLKLTNLQKRMRKTGRIHYDKHRDGIANIYTLEEVETRYTGEKLRKLRAERGVGSVRKIK